jgi:hypothetical protein
VQLRVPATALPRSAVLRFDFLAHFPALSAYDPLTDRTPHTTRISYLLRLATVDDADFKIVKESEIDR